MTDEDRSDTRRMLARRQVRTAGDRSAKMANTLMSISPSALDKLELDEDVREAVDRARKITAKVARRREERSLAGALRRIDLPALEQLLANVQTTGVADPRLLHATEAWRARLLDDDRAVATAALERFCTEVPGADSEELTRFVEAARREREIGKPPGAARALFRHLTGLLRPPT